MGEKMVERTTRGKRTNIIWVIAIATLLLSAGIVAVFIFSGEGDYDDYNPYQMLNRFNSYDELKAYVKSTMEEGYAGLYEGGDMMLLGDSTTAPTESSYSSGASARDYSTTNIQVEGVDEADIVKSDGTYLYVVSESNVTIVEAYPPANSKVLSVIQSGDQPIEIFVNGDRLVVFETIYYYTYEEDCLGYRDFCIVDYREPRTAIKTYDLSDRTNPILVNNVTTSGFYFDSRMIGDYVYVIVIDYLWYTEDEIQLPVIEDNGETWSIKATEVGYFDVPSPYYDFTLVVSIELDSGDIAYDVYLTDVTQTMYASLDNIYLVSTEYYYRTTNVFGGEVESPTEKTWIHKVSIDQGNFRYIASSRVPGRVLNQFSMDEHDDHFRIATTVGQVSRFGEVSSGNNIYILDSKLELTGKLEDLAPGESIYSARFMDDRGYLVTFRQVDPFFVIDLSNPESPKMLGKLKIPGYSNYLHPYDQNHIIGLGKENAALKLSLFDVTDFSNPIEISKYTVGTDDLYGYSDSYALWDHKAFLFSRSNDLLIIPVTLEKYDNYTYSTWQGAYIFSITLDKGYELKGGITHLNDTASDKGYWYMNYKHNVRRALYIEDYIYTVSENLIKISNMDTLQEITSIEI